MLMYWFTYTLIVNLLFLEESGSFSEFLTLHLLPMLNLTITKVSVESSAGGKAFFFVHPQMPLPHHVSNVSSLLKKLWEEFLIQWQTAGLARPDYLVL